jgi:hypothetical protein
MPFTFPYIQKRSVKHSNKQRYRALKVQQLSELLFYQQVTVPGCFHSHHILLEEIHRGILLLTTAAQGKTSEI